MSLVKRGIDCLQRSGAARRVFRVYRLGGLTDQPSRLTGNPTRAGPPPPQRAINAGCGDGFRMAEARSLAAPRLGSDISFRTQPFDIGRIRSGQPIEGQPHFDADPEWRVLDRELAGELVL